MLSFSFDDDFILDRFLTNNNPSASYFIITEQNYLVLRPSPKTGSQSPNQSPVQASWMLSAAQLI